MHLGGIPGSGKTYLGKIIKNQYNSLKVVDIDTIKDKYMEKPIEENMNIMKELVKFNSNKKKTKKQISLETKYENNFKNYIINKFKSLHEKDEKYVIVGHFFLFNDMYIDIETNNKVYLNVDNKTLFTRRNNRLLKDFNKNKKYFTSLIDNGEEFWKYNYLWNFADLKNISEEQKKMKSEYSKNKYKALNEEQILNLISKENI